MFKKILKRLSHTTLKRKFFLMVALVTITPTFLVAILALAYYYLGIEKLFNDKIGNTVSETVKIAELYLKEHKDNIRADTLAVANGLYKNYFTLIENPELFNEFLEKQAELRDLS